MIATYRLNTNELSQNLIDIIQKSFPNKEIEITVVEEDSMDYLKSNSANAKHIDEAINRIENNEGLISVDFSS